MKPTHEELLEENRELKKQVGKLLNERSLAYKDISDALRSLSEALENLTK